MIRIDDREKFEYLLNRGVLPSSLDLHDENVIHYIVKLEKISYLAYLFDGDYDACEWGLPDLQCLTSSNLLNQTSKSYMMAT